jgi:hypothetical protein
MKKIITVLGAIVSVFIMTSVVTAVPHINSKTIKENNILLSDFEEKVEKIKEKNVEKVEKIKEKNVLFNNIKEYVENIIKKTSTYDPSDPICIMLAMLYAFCLFFVRYICTSIIGSIYILLCKDVIPLPCPCSSS